MLMVFINATAERDKIKIRGSKSKETIWKETIRAEINKTELNIDLKGEKKTKVGSLKQLTKLINPK